MNNKIAISKLTSLLAGTTGLAPELCESFLRELFLLISERLADDDNVKVKGLGTFKVTKVEDRRSVNVNTGLEMIIPGHRKVSLTPDRTLAEAVNEPFAIFEAVEVGDAVTDEMLEERLEDADNMLDQESEALGSAATAVIEEKVSDDVSGIDFDDEGMAEDETAAELSSQNQPQDESVPASQSDENLPSGQINEGGSQLSGTVPALTAEENPVLSIPAAHAQVKDEDDFEDYLEEADKRAKRRFARGLVVGIVASLVVLIGLVALWRIVAPESFCAVTGTSIGSSPVALETAEVVTLAPQTYSGARGKGKQVMEAHDPDPEIIALHDEPVASALADEATEDAVPTAPSDSKKEEKKAETGSAKEKVTKRYDTITRKRFLTTMAKEYYGDYNLWPFIYDENKAILGHPDRIKPGTKVVIPPAEKYNIDASDKACVARAKQRGQEIYAKYKK